VQSLAFPDFEKDLDMVTMRCYMKDWEITHFWIFLKLHFSGFTNIKYLFKSGDYKTFNDTLCLDILGINRNSEASKS